MKPLLLASFIITILATTSYAGGYSFEIFLNNKLLLKQRHTTVIEGSPLLQLTAANANDNLRILFTNCGMTRKTRSIAIKDENGNNIKQWEFPNATGDDFVMSIPVKEILALQKKKANATLKIFYYSPDQFTQGQMLASLQPEGKKVALGRDGQGYLPEFTAGILILGALGWVVRKKIAA